MRYFILASLICLMLACSPEPDSAVVETIANTASATGTGSFRMGNGEIRDEVIQMMTDAGIEFWLGDNGIINYNLSDADAIDKIGNEVISEYITRN